MPGISLTCLSQGCIAHATPRSDLYGVMWNPALPAIVPVPSSCAALFAHHVLLHGILAHVVQWTICERKNNNIDCTCKRQAYKGISVSKGSSSYHYVQSSTGLGPSVQLPASVPSTDLLVDSDRSTIETDSVSGTYSSCKTYTYLCSAQTHTSLLREHHGRAL